MIFNITGGGGGAALNFNVVAYNTEEELLAATPSENTIGVVTDVPITSWIFDIEEPNPVTPGVILFKTDESSTAEFNALKKNTITLRPIVAKQYVDGMWVEKMAQCWQAGKWTEVKSPKLYIVKDGIEIIDIQLQTATKTAEEGFLKISGSGDGYHGAGAIVDVTNFKNLVLEGEIDTYVGYLCMWDIGTTGFTFNNAVSYIKSDDTRGGILPVETYSGKYRVGVAIIGGRSHKIANLYLE